MTERRRVIVESPYASHGLLTQPGVLRDDVPEERELGIALGAAWREVADATVVYCDLGISGGMLAGIRAAVDRGIADDGEEWGAE